MRSANARAFVPVDPKPAEPRENWLKRLLKIAGSVGVIDAQNESPAMLPGEEPIKEGGAHAPNVEVAGWARSKSGANGHRVKAVR